MRDFGGTFLVVCAICLRSAAYAGFNQDHLASPVLNSADTDYRRALHAAWRPCHLILAASQRSQVSESCVSIYSVAGWHRSAKFFIACVVAQTSLWQRPDWQKIATSRTDIEIPKRTADTISQHMVAHAQTDSAGRKVPAVRKWYTCRTFARSRVLVATSGRKAAIRRSFAAGPGREYQGAGILIRNAIQTLHGAPI